MDDQGAQGATAHGAGGGRLPFVIFLLVVLVAGGGWIYWTISQRGQALDRAQGALELQVLTSRLGVAALEAEYGNFEEARQVVSGVFDGIQNHGIEHGSLPENFEEVLSARDAIITALAREEGDVRDRLVALFFRLQVPIDTRLDPEFIIPASDSGIGMEPPRRVVPDTGMQQADSAVDADTLVVDVVPPDTGGTAGDTLQR